MGILDGLTPSQRSNANAMIAATRAAGLPQRAAVIVIETGLVESGLRVLANPNVPESVTIPHEGLGTDHASVGPMQQQVPSWGTAGDCMDPARSALKFLYGAGNNPGLLTLPQYRFANVGYPNATSWDQIPTGNAAQAVQVSAFPDRYQQQEATATQVVDALWTSVAPDSGRSSPLNPKEDDDMYALFQVVPNTPNAGRIYAVRAGSLPVWLSPTDLAALRRFNLLTNPSKPSPILQQEIDQLGAAIQKGLV